MNLVSVKLFFCRSDVRIIIVSTVTGGILQILSKRYLKNHPEFFLDSSESKKTLPRGGAVVEIAAVKVLVQAILPFLAEHGLTTGVASGIGILIGKIPVTVIATYVRDAFPQNLPELEKEKFILGEGKKLALDQCDQNQKYLFQMLNDETIPFEEKEKLARSILTKYLNLDTLDGRRNFVLCIVLIFSILATTNHSSFYLMMRSLIRAIKEGKISKAMARLIVRLLKKKGILIDPELADVVAP